MDVYEWNSSPKARVESKTAEAHVFESKKTGAQMKTRKQYKLIDYRASEESTDKPLHHSPSSSQMASLRGCVLITIVIIVIEIYRYIHSVFV